MTVRTHKVKPSPQEVEKPQPQPQPQKQTDKSAKALKAEMDAVLDEIDAVLVENAEEFVSQFVQRGGE